MFSRYAFQEGLDASVLFPGQSDHFVLAVRQYIPFVHLKDKDFI